MMTSKIFAITAFVFMVLGVIPASAGQCQDDVAKIDAVLAEKKDMAPDVRAQAEDMRNQAVQLCGAGNDEEGLAVTSEAKALLAID